MAIAQTTNKLTVVGECPFCNREPAVTRSGLQDHILTKHGPTIFERTHRQMLEGRTGKKVHRYVFDE